MKLWAVKFDILAPFTLLMRTEKAVKSLDKILDLKSMTHFLSFEIAKHGIESSVCLIT